MNMNMDMNKELPDIATSRGIEWLAFWHKRVTEYWSLGTMPASWKA